MSDDIAEVSLLEAALIFMGDPGDLSLPRVRLSGDRYIGDRDQVQAWRSARETEVEP